MYSYFHFLIFVEVAYNHIILEKVAWTSFDWGYKWVIFSLFQILEIWYFLKFPKVGSYVPRSIIAFYRTNKHIHQRLGTTSSVVAIDDQVLLWTRWFLNPASLRLLNWPSCAESSIGMAPAGYGYGWTHRIPVPVSSNLIRHPSTGIIFSHTRYPIG
jgi:hypothetical protein